MSSFRGFFRGQCRLLGDLGRVLGPGGHRLCGGLLGLGRDLGFCRGLGHRGSLRFHRGLGDHRLRDLLLFLGGDLLPGGGVVLSGEVEQGIDGVVLVADLKVDVGAGGSAGGAHGGHRLALGHRVAGPYEKLGAVGVVGLEPTRVGEDHQVAVGPPLSGKGDHAVRGGVDGGAGGGGDVDAPVEVGLTEDEPVAVVRGDGPLDRPQEEAALGELGLGLGAGAHDDGGGLGEGDMVQVCAGDGHAAALDHP